MKKLLQIFLIMTLATTTSLEAQKNNPLLADWNTPHHTAPFSQIKLEHYKPALRVAMKENKANIEKIIKSKAEPTFENTIEAMELAGLRLENISSILFNLNECNTSPKMQNLIAEILPELTRHSNEISLDERLFARVKTVYDKRNSLNLNAEQMKLLEDTYKGFVRSGALLSKEDKKIYSKNAEELSQLTQQFNKNTLADGNEFKLHLTKEENLTGLTESAISAARQEAENRGMEGWLFTLQAPSYGPFLTYSDNRHLREVMWMGYNSRGNRGNDCDNNEIIRKITKLRYEQAKLLGYNDYASYVLDNRMAENPETVSAFMEKLVDAAMPVCNTDLFELQRYARQHGFTEPIQPWDISYWSTKLKKEKYNFDPEALRPYFPLDKVREGIFTLYGRLYGLTFVENPQIEVYQEDVKAYEVMDGNRFMGVLYLDMYPRPSKSSGAWKVGFRAQSNMPQLKKAGVDRPIIQIVCNFSKPIGNNPALLSFGEVETFMHEFGHAIHGLLSDVTYPSQSGTSVLRDFVELPSQIMENWCYEKEFLNLFAHHYQTGDTLPEEYITKIKESENFMAGYNCMRQINFGMMDMAFHSITGEIHGKAEDFENKHIISLMPPIPGFCSSTAFTHIFSGGYAAGYYGYKWAEVLDADAFTKFQENGIFDKATAQRLRETILSKGGTKHPAQLFRDFMGRDPNPDALIFRSGFMKKVSLEK